MRDIGCITRDTFDNHKDVVIYKKRVVGTEAALVTELLTHWGMIAATHDGEDSAGRNKMRLLTPAELVDRACAIAELAVTEFEQRGWYLELPAPE